MNVSGTEREAEIRLPFPLEVVIGQTPLSAQAGKARHREEWKAIVGEHARNKIRQAREIYFLDDRPVMATIYYFPVDKMEGDIDNIIKPILDGMRSIAYPDDSNIEKVVAQKFEPDVPWFFLSPSPTLAGAIEMEKPAVYIRVDDSLSWRVVA